MKNIADINKTETTKATQKKFLVYLVSFLIAVIGLKAIFFLGVLLSSLFQKLPLAAGIVFVAAYLLAIYFAIVIFRKLVRYLKNELQ